MLRGISLALALAGCSQPAARQVVLKPGMTEQQVVEATGNRVPDRVVQRICGNETAAPFPCRIYVYEAAWRGGHYHPRVSAVSGLLWEDLRRDLATSRTVACTAVRRHL